ncbi:MAG: hypothetical protein EPO45_17715 [Sphingobium sp.]|nr:MAG: hypothetical protein EPO45_17715 [Sphingobium sp.]
MISVSLAYDSDGRLIPGYIPRRPDETLHDYLLRSRNELALHIRMLEATSDAQMESHRSERARWRRVMVILAIGEAGIAAAAYLLLDCTGLSGTASAPVLAAIIGSCGLAGAAASIGIASMLGRIASWPLAAEDLARRLLRRPRRIAAPSATVHPLARAVRGGPEVIEMEQAPETERLARDLDADPEIEEIIEDRAFVRLDLKTFLWGIALLVFQAATITLLLSTVRIAFGVPLGAVMTDAPLVLVVCLVGGFFLLGFSDLASTGLARLTLWWRRR